MNYEDYNPYIMHNPLGLPIYPGALFSGLSRQNPDKAARRAKLANSRRSKLIRKRNKRRNIGGQFA